MKNIQKVSQFLKYGLYFSAIVNVVWPFFILAHGKIMKNMDVMAGYKGSVHISLPIELDKYINLSLSHRILTALSSMPSDLIYSIALIFAAKLFECYEKGNYFSIETSKKFGNIGKFFIYSVVIGYPQELLFSFVVTMKEPVGQRLIRITASNHDFSAIMMAIMIVVVGWVMKEAVRLKNDQDLTV